MNDKFKKTMIDDNPFFKGDDKLKEALKKAVDSNPKPTPVFVIDSGVIRAMIEGDNTEKAVEIRNKLREMKVMGADVRIACTSACLKRALWKAKSTSTIEGLQEIIEFMDIIPSRADFKDREAVTKEVIDLAENLAKFGKKIDEG